TKSDENDPDVLNRVIREQPLEVVLHQCVKHAHHRGDSAERQHQHAPPPGGRADEVEYDAHEAVDGDFRHDPAHQRRDVARRCAEVGVGVGGGGGGTGGGRGGGRVWGPPPHSKRKKRGGTAAGGGGPRGRGKREKPPAAPASKPKVSSSASVPKLAMIK